MVRRIESRAVEQSGRERWRGLISEWSASGQTQVAFCRARGLNPATFAWWKRRLRGEDRGATGSTVRRGRRPWQTGRFVEVLLISASSVGRAGALAPAYEIVLSGGRAIRVFSPFDTQALSRLIAAVEAAPVLADGGVGKTC